MATLRERFISLFPGPRMRERFDNATRALLGVYERRNLLGGQVLEEYSTQQFDSLVRHLNDVDLLGQENDTGEPSEDERRIAVDEARGLYYRDVAARHGMRLWTNYGLGTNPQIIIKNVGEGIQDAPTTAAPEGVQAAALDEPFVTVEQGGEDEGLSSAADVFYECWTARRNAPIFKQRRIARLSDKALCDGELFFAAFYAPTGSVSSKQIASDMGIDAIPRGGATIRLLDTKQIIELISDPDDADVVCYYKREWYDSAAGARREVYYRSWDAHKSGAISRVKLPGGAKVEENCFVLHAEHNTIGRRGWPITTSSAPWLRAYKKFMQDRVTVAASKAMFVRRFVTDGGSRAVDAVRNFFSSTYQSGGDYEGNPAAVAGSSLVTNKAVDMHDLPINTGAGDAQTDGASIVSQAALGFSAFPHYFGRGEAFRLATTTSMEGPLLRTWGSYQQWWQDVFTDLVDMIVGIWEEVNDIDLPDYTVAVQIDPLVDVDIAKLSGAMVPMFQVGMVPDEQAILIAMQALGVENAQAVTDAFLAFKKEQRALAAWNDQRLPSPTKAVAAPDVPVPQVSTRAMQTVGVVPEDVMNELQEIARLAKTMLDPEAEEAVRQAAARALATLGDDDEEEDEDELS